MKRIAYCLILLLCLGNVKAQVAQWLIQPVQDSISMLPGTDLLSTWQGPTQYLWTKEGKRLEQVTDQLHPFVNGYAVATNRKTGYVTAFYDAMGRKIAVTKYAIMPAWNHAAFHDGYLLVNDAAAFYFMNDKGVINVKPHHKAYPFNNGYALCINYENPQKLKRPFYQLLETNLRPVALRWKDKMFDTDDIEFISSVNDAGISIVEAKGKIYFFNAENAELKPVLGTPDDTEIKNQARLDGSLEESLEQVNDTTLQLTAKSGKRGIVTITFDSMLQPVTISYSGDVHHFEKKKKPVVQLYPMLSIVTDNDGKAGLNWDNEEMLPPQFDNIPVLFDDKAIVMKNGKYGLLRKDKIKLRLNNGEPIGFRHHRFDSDIRIDIPSYVSLSTTSIEIAKGSGCQLNKVPYEMKETDFGNYACYRCELSIPDSLTDEEIDITYPAHVVYSQLRSPAMDMKSTAWHVKYFNVDINENDYSIANGTLSFTFNVSANREPGESIYPHEASIIADSLNAEITERLSETRYKGKVHDLHEGTNTFVIRIAEKGCPPSDFTFEVNYISRPARGEKKVTMKKKKEVATPRLRI